MNIVSKGVNKLDKVEEMYKSFPIKLYFIIVNYIKLISK